MKTKFLLPVMAMIFAIGMSFANVQKASSPSTDYVLQNGTYEPINMELNCGEGSQSCLVQFEPDGVIYEVYDAANPYSLKLGSGDVIELWR